MESGIKRKPMFAKANIELLAKMGMRIPCAPGSQRPAANERKPMFALANFEPRAQFVSVGRAKCRSKERSDVASK